MQQIGDEIFDLPAGNNAANACNREASSRSKRIAYSFAVFAEPVLSSTIEQGLEFHVYSAIPVPKVRAL